MTRTGPQQYPGASLKYDFSELYPGDSMESNVICLHSTEGTSVPTYGGGGSAPNFTVAPDFVNKRAVWYQHFDFDESSRALRNLSGGVQTNTLNVCQIEIVGTCDPAAHKRWTTPHLYTPELPDWFKDELAEFLAWAHKSHAIKLQSKRPDGTKLVWKPYPSSYGANGVRLSPDEWENFYGVLGHQHPPENDHGDPGDIDIDYILSKAVALANITATPTPPKPKPTYEPFPGAVFFKTGRKSKIILAMRKRLIAQNCNRYQSSSNPDTWGSGDEASYAAWQRKCGYSGSGADGIPGKTSWDLLKVPNV